jgi:uncharacterized membrane protein YdjX (TVP38/TMEM64 family)
MWWAYALVAIGSFLVDVAPIPLPPAFTVMIFLKAQYDLNIWAVVTLGVAASIVGRYVLTLYIPKLSGRFIKQAKHKDVEAIAGKLKKKGWKGFAFVLAYCLLPLPSTPLFLAAGMAHVKPVRIIPAFFVGKFISDLAYVFLGDAALASSQDVLDDIFSPKSILSLLLGLTMVFALLFVDWATLLQKKKLAFKFSIWNKGAARSGAK